MNVFILFLSTPLLKLFCRVGFSATFLPVSVTVWPALPDVEVRDGEEIQHGRDVLLVFSCIILQEVSTRAVDDANVPIRQNALHCALGSTSSSSHSFQLL